MSADEEAHIGRVAYGINVGMQPYETCVDATGTECERDVRTMRGGEQRAVASGISGGRLPK